MEVGESARLFHGCYHRSTRCVEFRAPRRPQRQLINQALSAYSAESVILGQGSDEQLTYEQVLSTIYADEDEAR